MEEKNVLKRVVPVALVFIIILGIALVFSGTRNNTKQNGINNANDAFATIGTAEITNQEMYSGLVKSYGASLLVDELNKALLEDYIKEAKTDTRFDASKEFEKLIYHGLTREEAKQVYTAEDISKFELNFKEDLALNNLTEESFKELMYTDYAKQLYVEDLLTDAFNNDEEYLVRDVKSFYETYYYDSVDLLLLEFNSLKEANDTLNIYGVTATKDGLNKNYYLDGKLILADNELYPKDETTLNSLKLSKDEVLEVYVKMYNDLYHEDVKVVNGKVIGATTYTYDELSNRNFQLTEYAFRSLNTNTNPYSINPLELIVRNAGQDNEVKKAYLVYKVDGDDANNFKETFLNNLTEEQYNDALKGDAKKLETQNDLYDTVVKELIYSDAKNTNRVNKAILKAYKDELQLEIHDRHLFGLYQNKVDRSFDNFVKNEDAIYTFTKDGNKVSVTADEFYTKLLEGYGANKLITLLNNEVFISDEKLVKKTINDQVDNYFKQTISSYKQGFLNGQYAEYGYTPANKTWDEFMYEMLNAESEKELYNNLATEYMANVYLSNNFRVNNKEQAYEDMKNFYEDSFKVNTRHILVYADVNHDETPDREVSTNLRAKAYELALMIDEELTKASNFTPNMLNNIVKEYNEATINDSKYGEFKQLGLQVTTEKIDGVTNTSNMEEAYVSEAKVLYDRLIKDGKTYEISTKPIKTSYGYHVLYATAAEKKLDAYPNDDSIIFPTLDDIEKFYNQDKTLDSNINMFITKYYQPALEERVNDEATNFLNDERVRLGVTISDSNVEKHYNEIVAVNKAKHNN